ncbi:di-trans,poly-cis-decaprenylcistransferase [Myxococcota bacterium]|nr:di-trans,poly-cis-decaprenylcistransferase [Myxococcota bacterium]
MIDRISSNDTDSSLHLAIIMDGNGRWAKKRGKVRSFGHRAGADAVRRIVEASAEEGIDILTLYAFSSDNWRRPEHEVRTLMRLFAEFLQQEQQSCIRNGIRLEVIGRRDRLAKPLQDTILAVEKATSSGTRMRLRLAVDYSARDAIMTAAKRLGEKSAGEKSGVSREVFSELLGDAIHSVGPAPDVDLLIRSGGEKRLSDFLLWECAYAELYFSDLMWPDFDAVALREALASYDGRERRFGALLPAAV